MSRPPARGALVLLFLLSVLAACRPESGAAPAAAPPGAPLVANAAKLLVRAAGIYAVTPQMLAAAGLPDAPLEAATARLSTGGETVPALYRAGSLYFYGQPPTSRYTAERPYLLELGQPGQAMPAADLPAVSAPLLETVTQTALLEENLLYLSAARQEEGDDVWYWAKLPQGETFAAEVTLPARSDGPATLRLDALGVTHDREVEGDHDLAVLVNERPVGEIVWEGAVAHTAVLDLPAGTLQAGVNTLLLDNRPAGATFLDIMQINRLALDYQAPAAAVDGRLTFPAADGLTRLRDFGDAPLLFDVSDPAQPRHIALEPAADGAIDLPGRAGMTIAAAATDNVRTPVLARLRASDWAAPTNRADLLIITTDDLAPALAPLVAAREAEGLAVAVAPVAEIYDAFGAGATSPQSIQAFVAHAYETWSVQPRYLLLVGDATSDYLGHVDPPPPNHVPALMVPVQYSGETVSDSRLADVDGDMRPDLAVGRWPARTAAEVSALVERTLAYEAQPAGTGTLFATDGSEAYFADIAARLVEEAGLPAADNVQMDGPAAADIAAAWQDAPWLAAYVGHGSIDRWGKEDILTLDTVPDLQGRAAPIVLQLTCLTGLFSHPQQTSLAEAMLAQEDGPVLIVAASSLTLSAHQEPFAVALLAGLRDPDVARVGDAFLAAKRDLAVAEANGLREISDTFNLLGDPSARIARP